jgi:tetratricopeptide (TPR) repeat protein
VAAWAPLLFDGVCVALVALASFILPVYTYQLLFEVPVGPHYWNSLAVLDYRAGFPELARMKFRAAAGLDETDTYSNLYLAHENLSSLALDDGDPYLALAELRRARGLVPSQVFGLPADTKRFIREIDAEYWNLLSVIYDQIGWRNLALESARNAVTRDPNLPEGHFDHGILMMKLGDYEVAATSFRKALNLDPGFSDAYRMLALAQAHLGRCSDASATLERIAHPNALPRRSYPHAVGTGELHDAAIMRRRHIADGPLLRADEAVLASCRDTRLGTDGGV